MDNLDQLSDDELRRRLLQFGFPNLPVTSTTRKILIKKLRNYMDTERTKLRRETTHATRYSSDEDGSSDATSSVSAATAQSHRRATRLGRSAARASVATTIPTAIPEPSIRSAFARPMSASAANYQSAPYQPLQHSSRTSLDMSRPTAVSTPIAVSAISATSAGRQTSRSPTVYVSPMLQGSSGDEDTDEDTADFGLAINTSTHSDSSNGLLPSEASDLPYVSEYTQRLLNLRGNTVAKDLRK